nr:MAG TPA: hypothetical protein [Bacteriophage sp.]
MDNSRENLLLLGVKTLLLGLLKTMKAFLLALELLQILIL